jgi:hypothetical protein
MYRFSPEVAPDERLQLKVEMNTREHAHLMGLREMPFKVDSGWYSGACEITTFAPEELFGTKLRALLQRRKNRTSSICTTDSMRSDSTQTECWRRSITT